MRITVDEITRLVRHHLAGHVEEREQEAARQAALIARYNSASERYQPRTPVSGLDHLRAVAERIAELERHGARPYRYVLAQHRELMERFYGQPPPDDVDRVQPPIRDQWDQHERVSPTIGTRATEAAMSTDDILVAIDESIREYDDEAHANEQAQADKIAARKDRRGETAAAGGASPSDILDRIALPGGSWRTEV